MVTEIIILGIAVGGYMLYKSTNNTSSPTKQANTTQDEEFTITVTMKGAPQSKEERSKYEEDVRRSTYEREFLKKHETLLRVIFYIVKADSTFNKQEKAIVRELIEEIEENNPYLTDRFFAYIYKKIKLTSIQAFKLNVNKILTSDEYDIDLLGFTKKIIDTQKTVHPNEHEVLDYLEKKVSKMKSSESKQSGDK